MTEENLVWEGYTGYQNNFLNISVVTPWNTMFKGTTHIRFLNKGEYSAFGVCDILLESSGAVRIGTYNFSDVTMIKERFPAVQESLLKELRQIKEKEHISFFSVFIGKEGYKILSVDAFTDYFPDYVLKDELFIFKGTNEEKYPAIFCMTKAIRSHDLLNFLDVIAYCSLHCFTPASEPTRFGKEFTYALSQNKLMRRPEYLIPNLMTIELPDNGTDSIRSGLTTTALNKLAERTGVDKLKKETQTPPPAKSSTKSSSGDKLTEDQERIMKSALEKEQILLSDVFAEGLKSIIALLSKSDFIVDVGMDIPDIARKGCIFEGKIHLIPYSNESETISQVDYGYIFDIADELVVVCSEETYPRKSTKTAGKEK